MSTLIEVGLVLVLIVANGIFSMSEAAVISARRARLQQRAETGDAAAQHALSLSEEPNIFLATVQIGITLIGILSGAFGGARLSGPVAELLEPLPGIAAYADTVAFVLVVLVITYLSLVVGELVPKRIALNNPESVAARVAGPMTVISRGFSPVITLLSASTNALLRLLRVRQSDEPTVTAEEVGLLLEQGARAGVFDPAEHVMAERIFAFADDRVSSLMTPRTDVTWINLDDSPEDITRTITESPYSRFPVARGSLDDVVGVVRAKDLLARWSPSVEVVLPDIFPKPFILPETTSALRALERFRTTGEHMAIAIDEYGGVAGILTLQDILEAIVGDLPDPGAPAHGGMVRRDDGTWLLDGRLAADSVQELLALSPLPGATDGMYETLAGFVVAQFGHIPDMGERFVYGGWSFEVVDMDGHRVDQVLASPADESAGAPEASGE